MAIQVEVWGEYACFTRPEMKTERVSYDCMIPSAARGLLESIYWHPGLMWRIDRIHVCRPIRFTNIRRNEVKDKISARNVKTVMERGAGELYLAAPESIQQRAAMVLQDVRYVIDAHFDLTEKAAPSDSPGKFQTSSSGGSSADSTTACPISERGSSRHSSAAARCFRRARRSCSVCVIWVGCSGIWIMAIRRTFGRGSSGPS